MELIEQKLRDCLHDLLKGKYSPNNINISFDLLNYIKRHSKDIGEILTIEVELLKGFEEEASRFSKRMNQNWPRFEILKESYKIISEQVQNYTYEDFLKRKSEFITEFDRAKEEEEERFRSELMDLKRNSPLRFQEENEKHILYSLKDMKMDLSFGIRNDKDINEFAVCHSKDVIYDKTYKLELVLFTKNIASLPADELKLEFYKYYVPEEFEKLEYELEKYYGYEDQLNHLSIIDSYSDRFSEEITKQTDGSIKECFELFNSELQNLRDNVCSIYGHPNKKPTNPENLIWTGSFQEFIEFFEPIIERREILYKGENDKYIIYSFLLNNIFIKNEPDKTIDNLSEILKIEVIYPLTETEKCKLSWNGSTKEFANVFKTKINRSQFEKSKFLYHGVNSLRAISKKLHEMFKIESQKKPGNYISERTLYQAFKG
jgi:hypothetical protein